MRTTSRKVLAVAAISVAAAGGCVNFSGPDLDRDPISPSQATTNQLFIGFQANTSANLTGDVNRAVTIWMQQMAGTGRQWLTLDRGYTFDENTFSFASWYSGGGLIDIRRVEANAKASNDQIYLGIAQVWEALLVGTTADVWGDIPYSQAADPAVISPKLDKQVAVYGALQTLLDQAIVNLGGAGAGPGSVDLVFGGDKSKWVKVAHTLKARYYLHTAETDPTAYAKALAETNLGISDRTGAGDFATYQSATVGEENQWFQFRRGRGTDIGGGKFLVDLLVSTGDPRLAQYFSPEQGKTTFRGAAPGEEDETVSWLSATRGSAGFRQPLVTYAENQLIKAEALARAGNAAAALAALNEERASAGASPVTGLTGSALLIAILQEKYIALFQNIEVWSDYRRTCYPNLAPANAPKIPARLLYGADERNANPNIPAPSQQPARNQNDPANATSLDGSRCLGQ